MVPVPSQHSSPDHDVLDRILAPEPPAFAVLYRPASARHEVDLLIGEPCVVDRLADLTGLADDAARGRDRAGRRTADGELVVLVPYRQLRERGFACRDDGTPLVALRVTAQQTLPVAELLARLPDAALAVTGERVDIDDRQYASIARRVIRDEIGRGEGSNFVIKRCFGATLADYSPRTALAIFRRLLAAERGSYWTFAVHTGELTFVGASPERHVSLDKRSVVMNPISGTYRYPASGPRLPDVLGFLADVKETDELLMVVDEELKMMSRICDGDVHVIGPFLKEMARVAHTEYLLNGRSTLEPAGILRETMFSPAVVGSPLESACRIVERHEPGGRGYYSGVLAVIGRDAEGERTMDSTILIRTARIDAGGVMQLAVGSTLVRHSVPEHEAAETTAKAAALLSALRGAPAGAPARHPAEPPRRALSEHPEVRHALERRNARLATFWLQPGDRPRSHARFPGCRAVMIDAEDSFTAMLGKQLAAFEIAAELRTWRELGELTADRLRGYDLIIAGPGPGDPRATDDPKIAALRDLLRRLLATELPVLAICLSHQVVCGLLGLELVRKEVPNQGRQCEIDHFGRTQVVGFYNTFSARSAVDRVDRPDLRGAVDICRDGQTGEVHALRGAGLRSIQFHAESVLSLDGMAALDEIFASLVPAHRASRAAHDRPVQRATGAQARLR